MRHRVILCLTVILCLVLFLGGDITDTQEVTAAQKIRIQPKKIKSAALKQVKFQPVMQRTVLLAHPWTDTFQFSLDQKQPLYYHDFKTGSKGRISVVVKVASAKNIRVLLFPPGNGREPVAVKEGRGTVRIDTVIRPNLMKKGNQWVVFIQSADMARPDQNISRKTIKTSPRKITRTAPRKITTIKTTKKLSPSISGVLKVTYPISLKLRPSPFVPLIVEEMRKAVSGHPSPHWRSLTKPGTLEILKKVISLYDSIPVRAKQELYSGPYLKKKAGMSDPELQSAALEAQLSLSLPPRTAKKPEDPPTLKWLHPGRPTPGIWVMLSGSHLKYPGRETVVILAKEQKTGMGRFVNLQAGDNLRVLDRQILFQIPRGMEWVGRYHVVITNPWGRAETDFEVFPAVHQAQRYKAEIEWVHCNDESDPEWCGSDEVYALIAVVRAAGENSETWQDRTATQGGYDDNEQKYVHWPFFGRGERSAASGDGCVVAISLM